MTPQPEPIASYQATARPRQEGCKHDCPGGTRAGSEHTLATAGPVRRDTDLGSCCPRSRTAGLADIDLADITAAQNLTVRSGADLDRLENLVMTVARPQGATLTCGLEVVASSSQPFWPSWPEAGKTCRHDPTTATSACTTPF